ncbi:MAG: aldehyde oxidase [Planctomycetota bacterium]|nr:MAG: aldehyde oxidase [Planctomycetota bacterium]
MSSASTGTGNSSRSSDSTGIGDSPDRVDGVPKVTGAALYVDDLPAPDAWHGATLRSEIPHGRFVALERDPDFDWSDVVVVTASDIGGRNTVALLIEDQPALVPVGGTIMHREEALALVAAPTRARARAALKALRVTTEALPAVTTLDAAFAADVKLHGSDNVLKQLEIHRDDADIEAVLAGCAHVIDSTYETGAQEQMYIEPQGVLAEWRGDTCRVVGSLQCPYYVHKALVILLGLPEDQVVVTQAVTGGGFGGKEEYPSMIAGHAALLAKAAKRPVKLIYDRAEDIAATTKRHPSRVRHRLGLDTNGQLVAADIDVALDGGAYVTLSPVVLSRAILHASGPYRIPHVRIVGRAMATNTPPHGAFRGFGAPQTTFAYERQMQKAARLLGVDAFALRRQNMLRVGDSTATGQVLSESVGSQEVLDRLEDALAQAAPPVPARLGSLRSPVRRGRGLAFYFHGSGFTGSGEERLAGRVSVACLASGDFEVRSSSTDIGQGMLTIFTQIAAQALDVPASRIKLSEPSTERVPDSGPTVASRTCMIVGKLVERACTALAQRLRDFATESSLDASDLSVLAAQHVAQRGELSETCEHESPPGVQWSDETYTGAAYPVFGWAACLVDVAVDEDTHEVTVERCLHAVDVGRAIHRRIVEGQIEGGTLQALGWALLESVPYEDGRVLNPSMTDCIIPTSADAPDMETLLVEVPYAHGPHGAKGVGEIPMDGPAAAVAGALEDALGIAADELPLLPEVLEHLLADAPLDEAPA